MKTVASRMKVIAVAFSVKNGHWKIAYARINSKMNKEPWDSSTEKAKTLKVEDFGTLDEVRKIAKMQRVANTKEETMLILKKITATGKLKSKSGLIVSLSGKSIEKIVSGQVLNESFDIMAHWQAAANIDKLFSNAIEPWKFELNPGKNNEHLKDRRYLFAPMEYKERILPVKFTVKEYKQEGSDNRLYSLEAIDVEVQTKKQTEDAGP